MSALAEEIQNTTKAFLKSYLDASQTKSMELVSAQLSDSCRRYIGPAAFIEARGAPPNFSMSNAEYAAEFNDMELYEFDDYAIYDLVTDTQNMKAVVRCELFVKFYSGGKGSRNFVFFLDFDQDARKIVKIYQLNDTAEANNWLKDISARKEAGK